MVSTRLKIINFEPLLNKKLKIFICHDIIVLLNKSKL